MCGWFMSAFLLPLKSKLRQTFSEERFWITQEERTGVSYIKKKQKCI